MRRKRVLIIFSGIHLPFSPTTINLYDALSVAFDVAIVSLEPSYFSTHRLEGRNVTYVRFPPAMRRICGWMQGLLRRLGMSIPVESWATALLLLKAARRQDFDEVIGIDFLSVWVAQRVFRQAHLLSLEIYDNDYFRSRVNHEKILSVVIQSSIRYERLYPEPGPPCFLIQNAPVYRPIKPARTPEGLVFCGTAVPGFGVFRCLDFLAKYREHRLTFKGAVPADVRTAIEHRYADLVADGLVVIDDAYLEPDALQEYLAGFSIGLCCYDLSLPEFNTFNYLTAPSGKLFTYYSAGVPVIASDIPGLSSVREFEAGVLIKEFTPEAVHNAIKTISLDHARFSENSRRAGEFFSFDKAVAPFCEFLRTRSTNAS